MAYYKLIFRAKPNVCRSSCRNNLFFKITPFTGQWLGYLEEAEIASDGVPQAVATIV